MSAVATDPRYPTLGSYKVTKELTFSNDTGVIDLFTITGDVIVQIIPVCTTNLASAAAGNVEVGISGATDAILPATLATNLDAREIWNDISPTSEIESFSDSVRDYIITDGNNVILTASAQIDSGAIAFYCYWTPLSDDGLVELPAIL